MIAINGAYIGQRVTGQQRYAQQITSQLVKYPMVRELQMQSTRSTLGSWAWAQTLGSRIGRDEWLLTLTSRGPVISPRHIITVHDLFVLSNPEWFSSKYVATHAPILRLQLANARAIVAVSEATAIDVRSLVAESTPVVVAPNAPSEIFFPTKNGADSSSIGKKYQLREGAFVFAVASQDPRKNLKRLVRAYEVLPLDFRKAYPLVLAGGGGASFRLSEEERAVIQKYSIGYVNDEELRWLYGNAATVVFPSLNEGFGLPVVEALAAGASLAVSDIPIMHWVAESYASYFDPYDTDSIGQGIMQSSKSATSNEAASAWVRSRYSWEGSAGIIFDFVAGLR